MIDDSDGRIARAPRRSRWHFLALVMVGFSGCEVPPAPIAIIPDEVKGRQAIEAMMATWKAGHPIGIIEPTSPRVHVVDTHRRPGQKPAGFEILSQSADSRARHFSVRVDLLEPEERPVIRFLVVGIDPILIFRQEDYELLMHWEHRMDPSREEGAAPQGPLPN